MGKVAHIRIERIDPSMKGSVRTGIGDRVFITLPGQSETLLPGLVNFTQHNDLHAPTQITLDLYATTEEVWVEKEEATDVRIHRDSRG